MVKSGLIVGGGMFLLVLLAAAGLSPLCSICVAVLAGLCGGYLAGSFDKPLASQEAVKKGAIAGAIAAGFGVLAQLIAAVINSLILQNPQFQIAPLLGLQTADPTVVWVGQLITGLCLGLLNVGITAGLGAGGGAIWYSTTGKKNIQAPPQTPYS